jgi:RNA polymerase sigma-70 factor (ECF subfamily)
MDVDVVVKAQGGDQGAFASLATESGRRMNALAYGILRDRGLAEDAVQMALVAIWKDLPRLREPAKFDSWSYKLLVRICYAEARKRRQRVPEAFVLSDRDPVASDEYRTVADRDQLQRGFDALSAGHRAVIVLHHYFDMPLESVAQVLDVPPGTARSRFHRAMRALRAALEADDRPPSTVAPTSEMQGVAK